ncbi:hypothetical protein ACTXT7_017389, partial [Hymenolepis weldensis]
MTHKLFLYFLSPIHTLISYLLISSLPRLSLTLSNPHPGLSNTHWSTQLFAINATYSVVINHRPQGKIYARCEYVHTDGTIVADEIEIKQATPPAPPKVDEYHLGTHNLPDLFLLTGFKPLTELKVRRRGSY